MLLVRTNMRVQKSRISREGKCDRRWQTSVEQVCTSWQVDCNMSKYIELDGSRASRTSCYLVSVSKGLQFCPTTRETRKLYACSTATQSNSTRDGIDRYDEAKCRLTPVL